MYHDYAIGYLTLTEAMLNHVPYAQMINKAGNIVVANEASVSFAVMEKGGNLNSRMNAKIVDSYSGKAWYEI